MHEFLYVMVFITLMDHICYVGKCCECCGERLWVVGKDFGRFGEEIWVFAEKGSKLGLTGFAIRTALAGVRTARQLGNNKATGRSNGPFGRSNGKGRKAGRSNGP